MSGHVASSSGSPSGQAKFPQLTNLGKPGVNLVPSLTNFSSASTSKSMFPLGIFPQLGSNSSISDSSFDYNMRMKYYPNKRLNNSNEMIDI